MNQALKSWNTKLSATVSSPPHHSHFRLWLSLGLVSQTIQMERGENCPQHSENNTAEEIYFHVDLEHKYCKYPPPS